MKKVVLVTGVSSGIGAASARLFSENGYKVAGMDRQELKNGDEKFVDEFYNVDLSKAAEIQKAFNDFTGRNGHLDALVNNAGAHLYKSVAETSIDEFQYVMSINVTAPFLLSKLSHSMLQKSKGAIVNVSSVHALATTPNVAAYATSKGALISMSRVLALEYAPDVRVNTVIPGVIDTPMMRGHGQRILSTTNDSKTIDEYVQELAHAVPAQRAADPSEVAQCIAFLADSSRSSYVSGQSLTVDGGMLAQLPGHR